MILGSGSAFAQDSGVTIEPVPGSSKLGCEEAQGCYTPDTVTVSVNDVITMSNTDSVAHTFTAGDPANGLSGEFDTDLLKPGESYQFTPKEAGEIPYFCTVHPWQQGMIIVEASGETMTDPPEPEKEGCLIATAAYGSELAPEVQKLREIRDNSLLVTDSGKNFMNSFSNFYYSFSPAIADYERENPVFKETVKVMITPMISSLSILNHVEMNSEAEVIGYGTSLILLNIGMYIGAPAAIVIGIRKGYKLARVQ